MQWLATLGLMAMLVLWSAPNVNASEPVIEDFSNQPESRWRFFSDTVMGGESTGQAAFLEDQSGAYVHLTGKVSTANNGGFIQVRTELATRLPPDARGVRLLVRGNEQTYFVHLRTTGTLLPWQYYQAGFPVSREWTEVRLPFTDFSSSGWLLRDTPKPESVTSLAVVAFGRDHEAEVDVREVGFYSD